MNANYLNVKSVLLRGFPFLALGAGSFLVGGCVVAERPASPRHVTVVEPVRPRETVVVREPVAPAPAVVVIREAPPERRHEVVVERDRPSPRHVWIAGYWAW